MESPVSFRPPFLIGYTLRGNNINMLSKTQILSFRLNPTYFWRATLYVEANRKSQKVYPFVIMAENNEVYHCILKCCTANVKCIYHMYVRYLHRKK